MQVEKNPHQRSESGKYMIEAKFATVAGLSTGAKAMSGFGVQNAMARTNEHQVGSRIGHRQSRMGTVGMGP
jgi:hypothetical protein